MKDFWITFANGLTGDNGPLYMAVIAITGLTLGWRFLGDGYTAEWPGGKLAPGLSDASMRSCVSGSLQEQIEASKDNRVE